MEQIFGSIGGVVRSIEGNDRTGEALAFAAWSRSAGEMLRERTVPVGFQRKRLIIAVSDIAWQRHLEDLSGQMLAAVNRLLGHGAVSFIEFQIDEKAVETVRKKPAELDSEALENVDQGLALAANAIANEDLRKQFLITASRCLAKRNILTLAP